MAVSDQTFSQERTRRLPRPGRRVFLFALAFVVTSVVGVAAVIGGLAVLHDRQAGRILPGISAAGADLSGMTPDEARIALAAHLADLSAGSVRIRSSLGSTKIAFTDVGRVPDIDAMVAQAVALGRGGTWLDETIAGIRRGT